MVFYRPRTRSERDGTLPIQYNTSLWYSSDEDDVREMKDDSSFKRSEKKRNGAKDIIMKNRNDKGKNVAGTSDESDDDDVRIISEDNSLHRRGKSGISVKNARRSSVVWKNNGKSSKKKKIKVKEVFVEIISNDTSEEESEDSSSGSVYYSEPSSCDDVAVSLDDAFVVSDDVSFASEDERDVQLENLPYALTL